MSRPSLLITLGVLVLLAPFSGLPYSWLEVLLPLFGLVTALIGLSMRTEVVKRSREAAPLHDAPSEPSTDAPSALG